MDLRIGSKQVVTFKQINAHFIYLGIKAHLQT